MKYVEYLTDGANHIVEYFTDVANYIVSNPQYLIYFGVLVLAVFAVWIGSLLIINIRDKKRLAEMLRKREELMKKREEEREEEEISREIGELKNLITGPHRNNYKFLREMAIRNISERKRKEHERFIRSSYITSSYFDDRDKQRCQSSSSPIG